MILFKRKLSPPVQALLFLCIFAALQTLWSALRTGDIGNFVVDGITVKAAVGLINIITPDMGAVAHQSHISAPSGGINVINGCEGIDVMLMLIASMLIAPIAWRKRLTGMLMGIVVIFLLNQIRLVAMFYAISMNRPLFELLHGMVAPILLIALTGLFYAYWLSRDVKEQRKSSDAIPS